MTDFAGVLKEARSLMDRGAFRGAFDRIVDVPASRPDDIFAKTAVLADAGAALFDTSVLEYGLYLLELHASDLESVPGFLPYVWLNIANLRANILALREADGEKRCWYEREKSVPVRKAYAKAASASEGLLKSRILTVWGRVLCGLGRDWEAFELFHNAWTLDPENSGARLGRAETLIRLSGASPKTEDNLQKEAAEHLNSLKQNPEHAQTAGELLSGLNISVPDQPVHYPKNTLTLDDDHEHAMVMHTLKHHLFLNPCAACHQCERAVGDTVAFGPRHARVKHRFPGWYKKNAAFTARLTEHYQALRTAVTEYAAVQDGFGIRAPLCPPEAALLNALAGSRIIVDGLNTAAALLLGVTSGGAKILGTPEKPGQMLLSAENSSLHGFWDLWADGMDGLTEGAQLPGQAGEILRSFEHPGIDDLSRKSLEYLKWLRSLTGYLISAADNRTEQPPLWPLQPFVFPGEFSGNKPK